jgi:N6-L-threonylcarbamoyladenine synthase
VEKLLRRGIDETGLRDVLLVGGVAANRYLRQRLTERLGHRAVKARVYFAEPRFSADNALGTALIGLKKMG